MKCTPYWFLILLFLFLPGFVGTIVVGRWWLRGSADKIRLIKREAGRQPASRPTNPSQVAPDIRGEEASAPRSFEEALSYDQEDPDSPWLRGPHPVRIAAVAWNAGLTWKVETFYLQMEHGPGETWSSSILWQFTVRGRQRHAERDVWVVDVEPTDLSDMPFNPGGQVYVAVDDQSILAVRDRIQENGMIRDRFIELGAGDSSAISSLLPVDLPAPGTEGLAGKSWVGAHPPNPFRPDPNVELPRTSGTAVDVEFEAGGERIRQRWDAANGIWPLYSSNPSRVSFLRM